MAAAPKTPDASPPDVVLDLLAEDASLREALGQPLPIRLPTGDVITVPAVRDWPHMAPRYAANRALDLWAETILAPADFEAWKKAKLRTYQTDRIMAAVEAAADASPGK